jgi:transposase-like protein
MSKRRRLTAEFKARIVLEEVTGIKDRVEICREHRLSPQVLARWREGLRSRDVDRTRRASGC